jgi:DNA-binding NarL/FixJ family response regulator
MKRIRLIVVEDNRLLREGLKAMLNEQADMSVVAALSNGEQFKSGKTYKADVILLDLVLRNQTSLRLVETIKAILPGAKIIVMDLAPVQPALMEFVEAGVWGFVLKDATFNEFIRTIREVARGVKVLPSPLTSSLFSQIVDLAARNVKGDPFKSVRMTNREKEVIELIAEGLSNKAIATRLNLAVDTVKSHVHNILEKLQVHTRLEIARFRHADGPFLQRSSSAYTSDE